MAIITFKSNESKETGQTLSRVAVATQMAIEHSHRDINYFYQFSRPNIRKLLLGVR